MTLYDWFWISVCAVIVVLPPKWDPAIRLKERMMERRNRD